MGVELLPSQPSLGNVSAAVNGLREPFCVQNA
jgi:hypothetical protein